VSSAMEWAPSCRGECTRLRSAPPRALRCSPRGLVTAVSADESGGTEAWRGGVRTRVEDKRRRSRLLVRVRADDPSPPCLGSAGLISRAGPAERLSERRGLAAHPL